MLIDIAPVYSDCDRGIHRLGSSFIKSDRSHDFSTHNEVAFCQAVLKLCTHYRNERPSARTHGRTKPRTLPYRGNSPRIIIFEISLTSLVWSWALLRRINCLFSVLLTDAKKPCLQLKKAKNHFRIKIQKTFSNNPGRVSIM